MKKQYREMKSALDAFLAGSVSPDGLKPLLAPSGIYQQKNGLFMARVRITGGEVAASALEGLAERVAACGGYAHLTSRQDLQVHDLPADRLLEVVQGADRLGLPFKGGGGNTYRNTLVSGDSGYAAEAAFDVHPYAQALHRVMLRQKKAFELPRKLKVGFFAKESDRVQASVQDLGFLAQVRDGRRGFTVYAAGGQGRDSAVGVKLFDFLDARLCLRAALALLALFHDHGDRTNRHQARLRFVLRRLGPEAFLRLYLGYFADTQASDVRVPDAVDPADLLARLKRGAGGSRAEGFVAWERVAVRPTVFGGDVKSVRLFVPYGNLSGAQLRTLARLVGEYCPAPVRLLPTQDLLVPLVHASALPELHARLLSELGEIDLTFRSYKGHVLTCVGANVCKIGMVDSPAVGDRIAVALDRYLPADTPEKLRLLRLATDDLRISGCPNSCASHHSAQIGIACLNQKVDGEVRPFARLLAGASVVDGEPRISQEIEPGRLIAVEELADVVVDELLKRAAAELAL